MITGSPDNVVTFREADAALVFVPFKGEEIVSIRFEFKTTNADGVLIHGNGDRESNFIQIQIESKAVHVLYVITAFAATDRVTVL